MPSKKTVSGKAITLILVTLVFGVVETACAAAPSSPTPNPNLGDGGFFSGEPCGPPCFFSIVPGTTPKEQAIQLLQSQGLYQDCQDFDNSKQGGIRGITCSTQIVIFQQEADIVVWIGFSPLQTLTVSEVIANYGDPSAVSVSSINPSNQRVGTMHMTLYYDNIHVQLGLAEQNSDKYDLVATTPVTGINYFSQTEYERGKSYSQKWKGYGVYEESYP